MIDECFVLKQVNNASILSLPLPIMVLLWGTLTFPRPSKTFWVTIIAYTQTVVVIKCLCQFEAWPFNSTPIPANQPFAPARILGIEKKKGYATYDLILLLVVFCHRIILKSLGLWKSEVPVESDDEEEVKKEVVKVDEKEKSIDEKEENDIKASSETIVAAIKPLGDKVIITETEENGKSVRILDDSEEHSLHSSIQEKPNEHLERAIKYMEVAKVSFMISFNKYSSSVKEFFRQLFDRESRQTADIYTFLFICDFVNFFVILFGFAAFGTQEGDGGVMSYLEENKVPLSFLLMLIIQFFLIVIDRALYLRKNMTGKIIYQICLIFGLHIWMFFVLPSSTERMFNATRPPITFYMIKCVHLLFSAYQIRCGKLK